MLLVRHLRGREGESRDRTESRERERERERKIKAALPFHMETDTRTCTYNMYNGFSFLAHRARTYNKSLERNLIHLSVSSMLQNNLTTSLMRATLDAYHCTQL